MKWTIYKNNKPYLTYTVKDSALRDALLITQVMGYRNWITDRTGYRFGDSNNYYELRNDTI